MKNHETIRVAAVVALLVVLLGGCVTPCPPCPQAGPVATPATTTNDPVVINTEKFLKVSDGVYDSLMSWAFANKATLSKGVADVLENVRLNYDRYYKAIQAALDVYKAVRNAEAAQLVAARQADMNTLLASGQGARATVTGVQ